MEIVRRLLRMCGGGEDRPLIGPEHLQPMAEIADVILPNVRCQLQVAAEERCAELGDEFLHGVTVIPEAVLAEAASEAALMPRPVRALMRKRGVIAFGIAKHLERRHLDVITADRVVGAIPTVAHVGAGGSEKGFYACIAGRSWRRSLDGRRHRHNLRLRDQSFYY
jgi:hypothetical protein